MEHLTSSFFISEVLAAIVATLCFSKYKHTAIWPIMPLLWMAVIAETSGVLYYEFIYPNNIWIFNLYGFLYYALFYYMIYSFVKNKKRQKVIIALSCVVIISYAFNLLIVNPIYQPLTYARLLGTVVMVLHLMYAAIEVLKSDAILKVRNSLPFFIFSGYLLIEITLIPVGLIRNMELHLWSLEVYNAVNNILGIILIIANSYFIFGFLWTRSDRKS